MHDTPAQHTINPGGITVICRLHLSKKKKGEKKKTCWRNKKKKKLKLMKKKVAVITIGVNNAVKGAIITIHILEQSLSIGGTGQKRANPHGLQISSIL